MKDEKLRLLSLKLVSDNENYMSAFRKNIDMYIGEKDITLRDISESADLSFDTLKTFVYGNGSDCKLSTAIRLSKAFQVSIDELGLSVRAINAFKRVNIHTLNELIEFFSSNDISKLRCVGAKTVKETETLMKKVAMGGWELSETMVSIFEDIIEIRILKRLGLEYVLELNPTMLIWGIMVILIFCVAKLKNTQEKMLSEKYNWMRSIITIGLMIWCIISLSDVSEFLYFNF